MGKRNISNVKCKICKRTYKINGFDSHLRHTHDLTTKEYREKYGEYRPKYLKYEKRADKLDGKYKCEICDEECASERHLSHHVRTQHDIKKRQYVIEYIFENELPTCECGCGEEVTILNQHPYHRTHLPGHNVYMHLGKKRSYNSRMKMRKAARKRMEEGNGTFYNSGPSEDEQLIADFISEYYDGPIIQSDTETLSGLEIDILLPEKNIAIEYNGSRFHSDQFKEKQYHLKKTKECNRQGIDLVHIWEPDWYHNREIIESQLKYFLNKIPNRVYARKCEIVELTFNEANKFLAKNHLQGQSVSKYRYGLKYNGELVQVMTFGNLRHVTQSKSKEDGYELLRFASLKDTQIVGGASKLFAYFIESHDPSYILSFANRDWASGGVYEVLGFDQTDYTAPGYFYVKGKRRFHRYNFQKHKLVERGFDPNKTEREIMEDEGYYRIWDTGNIKYEWTK